MAGRDAKDVVSIIELGIDMTNDEVIAKMRLMKSVRDAGVKNVVCSVSDFNEDPRELYAIPEVRAFCRRLVNLGFISYLDVETGLLARTLDNPEPVEGLLRDQWGAFDVWLCGEGRTRPRMEFAREEFLALLEEFQQALGESNEKADAALAQ
jgi:hypothetical protein